MKEIITKKPKQLKDILALYHKDDIKKRSNGGYTISIPLRRTNSTLTINGDMMDAIKDGRTLTLEKNSGLGGKYHYKEVGDGWFWRMEWLQPPDELEKELFEI